jgi:hypothetical protein
MRVTLALLGWTLDWSLEPTATEAETCSLDGGTTAAYPMGFTHWPVPEEIAAPQHCPSWDEPEEQA